MKDEIIIYQVEEGTTRLEVKIFTLKWENLRFQFGTSNEHGGLNRVDAIL